MNMKEAMEILYTWSINSETFKGSLETQMADYFKPL